MVRTLISVPRTVFSVLVVGLATGVSAAAIIVIVKLRPDSSVPARIMRVWAKLFLFCTGTKVTVEGLEHVDPDQSYVVTGNHTSNLDIPVILGCLPVPARFLAKRELFRVPLLGGGMRGLYMVETDRRAGPAAHRAIHEQVARAIGKGLSLMIFPEGTRSQDGDLLPFKKGAFRIAVDNDMPVLPVTIVGARAAWEAHSKLIRGGPVRLVIHEPIPTTGLDRTELDDLRDRTKGAVGAPLTT